MFKEIDQKKMTLVGCLVYGNNEGRGDKLGTSLSRLIIQPIHHPAKAFEMISNLLNCNIKSATTNGIF